MTCVCGHGEGIHGPKTFFDEVGYSAGQHARGRLMATSVTGQMGERAIVCACSHYEERIPSSILCACGHRRDGHGTDGLCEVSVTALGAPCSCDEFVRLASATLPVASGQVCVCNHFDAAHYPGGLRPCGDCGCHAFEVRPRPTNERCVCGHYGDAHRADGLGSCVHDRFDHCREFREAGESIKPRGLTWWRFGPDRDNMLPGYRESQFYVCVRDRDQELSISTGISSHASMPREYRRTLLIALMMAEGIEPEVIDLVRTGADGPVEVKRG